jgi:hypothetical protein
MPPAMPYTDWTPTFALAGAQPSFSLASSVVAYTNIGYVVSATSLGAGATSAGARFEVATDDSFSSVVTNIPLSFASSGGAAIPVVGLATNTAYWARVSGTNSAGVAAAPVVLGPLTTLTPGTPVVSIKKLYEGFSHTTWTVTISELGVGAKDASIWLDLSAAGDFADALSFGGGVTDGVPAAVTIDAPGLAHGTTYAVRGRAVNDWGVPGVSAADEAVVREEPVEMREPGFETGAAPGEMVLSIEADDVEPGATYAVTLAVDGSSVRSWPGLSEAGVVSTSWTGAPGRTHEGVFTVVSALGGQTWTRRYPFSFAVGARERERVSANENGYRRVQVWPIPVLVRRRRAQHRAVDVLLDRGADLPRRRPRDDRGRHRGGRARRRRRDARRADGLDAASRIHAAQGRRGRRALVRRLRAARR